MAEPERMGQSRDIWNGSKEFSLPRTDFRTEFPCGLIFLDTYLYNLYYLNSFLVYFIIMKKRGVEEKFGKITLSTLLPR